MGERKGQNKYYPPDYDPKKGGLNKFLGVHALRERARKIHMGIIIIRFEMPYNIWCNCCKNHIGMGVRYNAEKSKVGMYYSTPIYKFRMKCHLCDNHFEIQTDPANLDYVILSGARRQENRWDPTENGQVVPDSRELQKRLLDDAMFKLDHQAKDVASGEKVKPALEKLIERNKTLWNDYYEANCTLRADFRKTKKELKVQQDLNDKLLNTYSLKIPLLPESEQDRQMASLLNLQCKSAQKRDEEKRLDILLQPILPGATDTTFIGLKRQKALDNYMKTSPLGIKTKANTKCQIERNEKIGVENFELFSEIEKPLVNVTTNNIKRKTPDNNIPATKTINLSNSLALISNYSSANSSPESVTTSDYENNDVN